MTMLTARRVPIYISLCLIICLIGMALCIILIQSSQKSSALWAERAADLYVRSLDMQQEQESRTLLLAQSRLAMLKALEYTPYNTAHWIRLSVIDGQTKMAGETQATGMRDASIHIIKRLNSDFKIGSGEYILPSVPPRPIEGPD